MSDAIIILVITVAVFIGIVLQDFALIENYSVFENVMVPTHFCKGKNQIRSRRP